MDEVIAAATVAAWRAARAKPLKPTRRGRKASVERTVEQFAAIWPRSPRQPPQRTLGILKAAA